LQLRDKIISCLDINQNLFYPPAIYPKILSLRLINKIETHLLKNICTDKELRDFLCVNIQAIGDELHKKRYFKFIESKNQEESIFVFKKFGFVNDDSMKKNEEEYYNYLKDLTLDFASKIDFLGNKKILDLNKNMVRNFEVNLLNPFLHLLRSINLNPKSLNKDLFEIDAKSPDVQNLIMAWQNKTIFERVIARLINNKLKCEVYCSKFIVINNNDPLAHSLEFDNIFVWNNRICFIELKNGLIKRNDVFTFLGKVRAVEEYYKLKVNKIAVIGTRTKDETFDELESKVTNFKVFDIDDYYNNLERFFEFIKS